MKVLAGKKVPTKKRHLILIKLILISINKKYDLRTFWDYLAWVKVNILWDFHITTYLHDVILKYKVMSWTRPFHSFFFRNSDHIFALRRLYKQQNKIGKFLKNSTIQVDSPPQTERKHIVIITVFSYSVTWILEYEKYLKKKLYCHKNSVLERNTLPFRERSLEGIS